MPGKRAEMRGNMETGSNGKPILTAAVATIVFEAVYIAGGAIAGILVTVLLNVPILGAVLRRIGWAANLSPLLIGSILAVAVSLTLSQKMAGSREAASKAGVIAGWAVLAINAVFLIANIANGNSVWGNIIPGIFAVVMVSEAKKL